MRNNQNQKTDEINNNISIMLPIIIIVMSILIVWFYHTDNDPDNLALLNEYNLGSMCGEFIEDESYDVDVASYNFLSEKTKITSNQQIQIETLDDVLLIHDSNVEYKKSNSHGILMKVAVTKHCNDKHMIYVGSNARKNFTKEYILEFNENIDWVTD